MASDAHVEKGNIVLVDIRDESMSKKGHIKRAVNIPFGELEEFKDDFPAKAPIVIYGNDELSQKAYHQLTQWKLKTVALLEGGMEAYLGRGHQMVVGEPAIDIEWTRKMGKGEVGVEEFMKVVEKSTADKVILDIRNLEETDSGKFASSLAIPLDALENRLAELPKDKEILLHCSTGARAEMAHEILVKAGLKSRFLVADVKCEGVGECSVN